MVGFVADRGHHGERQHDERDVPMPAMPGAGFVVIETKFVLGGLEAVFDRPAMTFDPDQRVDLGSCRTPGCEERQLVIGNIASDQQAARPSA